MVRPKDSWTGKTFIPNLYGCLPKLVWMSSIEAVVEKFVISYKYKFCPMFQNI